MANGRNRATKVDLGRDSGGFVALPWTVLDCPAYAALSYPARALLIEVARQFVRDNNGRMLLSIAYLSKRGWKSSDVITRAKRELLAAGFIFETVMGHRPNKASWYAVTWRALDKLQGYDEGATASFVRGAYRSTALKPQLTREQLYEKWRGTGADCAGKATTTDKKPTKKNTSLTPAHGLEDTAIAPPGGVEAIDVVPPGGAIDPVFAPLSIPSYGNHLEMPSTAVSAVSANPSKGNGDDGKTEQVDVVRMRESEIEASLYDPTTGEYFKPPSKPVLRQKQAADTWVKSALSNRQLA
jgi:hypothetical protein